MQSPSGAIIGCVDAGGSVVLPEMAHDVLEGEDGQALIWFAGVRERASSSATNRLRESGGKKDRSDAHGDTVPVEEDAGRRHRSDRLLPGDPSLRLEAEGQVARRLETPLRLLRDSADDSLRSGRRPVRLGEIGRLLAQALARPRGGLGPRHRQDDETKRSLRTSGGRRHLRRRGRHMPTPAARVRRCSWPACLAHRRSASARDAEVEDLTCRPSADTFSGFRSRWTMPCSCAARPGRSGARTSTACFCVSAAPPSSISRSDSPSRSSVTAYGVPSCRADVVDQRECSGDRAAPPPLPRARIARAVRVRRDRRWITLTATSRSSHVSRARSTSPIPPAPRGENLVRTEPRPGREYHEGLPRFYARGLPHHPSCKPWCSGSGTCE